MQIPTEQMAHERRETLLTPAKMSSPNSKFNPCLEFSLGCDPVGVTSMFWLGIDDPFLSTINLTFLPHLSPVLSYEPCTPAARTFSGTPCKWQTLSKQCAFACVYLFILLPCHFFLWQTSSRPSRPTLLCPPLPHFADVLQEAFCHPLGLHPVKMLARVH